jgi:hypothetical protein
MGYFARCQVLDVRSWVSMMTRSFAQVTLAAATACVWFAAFASSARVEVPPRGVVHGDAADTFAPGLVPDDNPVDCHGIRQDSDSTRLAEQELPRSRVGSTAKVAACVANAQAILWQSNGRGWPSSHRSLRILFCSWLH